LPLGRFPGCAVFRRQCRTRRSVDHPVPTPTSFIFLQSITQQVLAAQPQQAAPLLGFRSLQHKSESLVHFMASSPHSPTFRLQGLVTLLTVSSQGLLVSFVSHLPRSWDSPLRSFASGQGTAVSPPQFPHMSFRPQLIWAETHTDPWSATPGYCPCQKPESFDRYCQLGIRKLPWGFPF
jgi:hypothetical protein